MVTRDSVISLREITRDSLDVFLKMDVTEDQKKSRLVAPNPVSIAQAHFYQDIAWFRGIYADETPVGFVMLADDATQETYMLWRLMIDAQYQKMGFGSQAVMRIIDYVKTRPGAEVLMVSHSESEGNPGPFYEKLGFVYNGEKQYGELVMLLDLAA